ncbi:MAG: DUF4347 domain-containing protein, partial [Rhodocyclaceae bacterium]|nr:DUF4347 domain-containing protein [Rhodocyclaceae bacterium]
MFDGAAVATAADALHHDVAHEAAAPAHTDALAATRPLAAEAPAPAAREIAFVDTRLTDWQSLVAGIRPGIEVVLVQPDQNGVDAMLAALQGQHDLAAIYVFGHGATGTAELGSSILTTDSLARLSGQLATIGAS